MTITATFSNGFTDTYKGTRAVTAAWMITETATGKVVASGHSMTPELAHKSGRASVPKIVNTPWTGGNNSPAAHRIAKKLGYRNSQDLINDYRAQNAEHAKRYAVEVVSL